MRRLQLHVLQPDTHVPTFVTRNGVSYNDFLLVSSGLLARCKGTFVKLDSGLHGHRPVCFKVPHRGPTPKYRALVRGATIQFVRKHSCQAQPADFVPVSKGLQVAAQQVSGARREEALTCAYEAWSMLAVSELISFLGIDGQKQVDVAYRFSCRDVKTRWVVLVACVNTPVYGVEVSKRAWCIARDHLTDLLCVVQKRVFPSYASQVGRALMTALRRWPDEFGGQWFAALMIWAGIARWAPDFLSGLHGHLAAARDELANIARDMSCKAASARVRRWRKWAQFVVSDQSKPAFQWTKGRDLIPLPVPVMSDGDMLADTQVLVDDEFRKWQCM